MSRQIQTIVSPILFSQIEQLDKKIVVVIDVLRATSTICTILGNGAHSLRAVASEKEAQSLKQQGLLVGGERNGQTIEGFDFGNSPLEYTPAVIAKKDVALTTTNGTKCIEMSADASQVIIGSFLNLSAVCDFIDEATEDVVLFCAGWKDRVNLEDSLFAGAVCHGLTGDYTFDDASLLAQSAYSLVEDNLYQHLQLSSHFGRLSRLGVDQDIEYCCRIDELNVVPVLNEGIITLS